MQIAPNSWTFYCFLLLFCLLVCSNMKTSAAQLGLQIYIKKKTLESQFHACKKKFKSNKSLGSRVIFFSGYLSKWQMPPWQQGHLVTVAHVCQRCPTAGDAGSWPFLLGCSRKLRSLWPPGTPRLIVVGAGRGISRILYSERPAVISHAHLCIQRLLAHAAVRAWTFQCATGTNWCKPSSLE